MKILFLTRVMPVHGNGGMQQHAQNIINYLKKNFSVTVITTAAPDGKNEETEKNLKVIYLKNTRQGKYYGGWWRESEKKIKKILKGNKFDIILSESVSANSFFSYGIYKHFSIPVISFCHGTFPKEVKTTLKKSKNFKMPLSVGYKFYNKLFIDKNFYPKLSGMISTSSQIHKYLRKKYPAIKNYLIYNGIDTKIYLPKEKNKNLLFQYGFNSKDIILLCVSRLEKEKGIDNLLDIFPELIKKFTDIKLVWVGEGSYKKKAERKIKKTGLVERVKLVGRVDQEKLPQLYNIADIFVFPTLCDEGMPLVILESISSGLPVVCSINNGVKEIIEDGKDGFLFPAGNSEILRKKIETIINLEKLNKMRENVRKKAETKFSLDEMGKKTLMAIRELLDVK